jgi:hypothetical protein
MNLPARQQRVLDRIEQALQAADPGLKSMFASWGRWVGPKDMPATEIVGARLRPAVMVGILAVGVLIIVLICVPAAAKQCPRLSSDQVVATAAVRLASCNDNDAAWSKGGR